MYCLPKCAFHESSYGATFTGVRLQQHMLFLHEHICATVRAAGSRFLPQAGIQVTRNIFLKSRKKELTIMQIVLKAFLNQEK